MPRFDNGNTDEPDKSSPKVPNFKEKELERLEKRKEIERKYESIAPPALSDPRCHVCQSEYRQFIEAMLVRGWAYVAIADKVPGPNGGKLDRRSVSNHAKNHMNFQDEAIRRLLEEESEMAQQNYEEGVRGAITHRGVLEVALRKAYHDILSGNVEVEPKDLVNIIQVLQKMDEKNESVALDELRSQVTAFIQAIKEETDRETWGRIAQRTRKILGRDNPVAAIAAAPEPEVIDVKPVEDDDEDRK